MFLTEFRQVHGILWLAEQLCA